MPWKTLYTLAVLIVFTLALYFVLDINSVDVMETLKQHNPLASEQ